VPNASVEQGPSSEEVILRNWVSIDDDEVNALFSSCMLNSTAAGGNEVQSEQRWTGDQLRRLLLAMASGQKFRRNVLIRWRIDN